MSRQEAINWLGPRYVLHPAYRPQPHHSNYARVDLAVTFARVRNRMRQEQSFSGAVEQVRQRLRMVHGRVA